MYSNLKHYYELVEISKKLDEKLIFGEQRRISNKNLQNPILEAINNLKYIEVDSERIMEIADKYSAHYDDIVALPHYLADYLVTEIDNNAYLLVWVSNKNYTVHRFISK